MKPFLGIDLTFNKKNELQNGSELIVARPSVTLTQAFESESKKNGRNDKAHQASFAFVFYSVFLLCCNIRNNRLYT